MRTFSALVVAAMLVISTGSAGAHSDDPRGNLPDDLAAVTKRLSGGSSLLFDLDKNRATERFHDAAHHLDESVREGSREGALRAWADASRAWRGVAKGSRRDDDRRAFLLTHLETEMQRAERLLGSPTASAPDADGRTSRQRLVSRAVCVGPRALRDSCRERRDEITIRIPRDVTHLRELEGEWRDFGRKAHAEILVNDRVAWAPDVGKNWDVDRRQFDLEVPPRSVLTIRSSNGEPFEIRRLDVTWERATTTTHRGRTLGDFFDQLGF